MANISVFSLSKFVFTLILALIAIYSWVYSYYYYQIHHDTIWLNAESIVQKITLPIKIAQLSSQEPLNALQIPVLGVQQSQIADTWGAARSEGRSHEGVDIFAETGTPVFAAAPGYVVRAGENRLGGTIVFTLGPGGVRYYYAHLNKIAPDIEIGSPVDTQTIIGYVGNSGNAENTPPHLHFGIYSNGAQNPYPLLINRF
jgi:murein DD-endopeptidase MepM/ murein hydrolase activator NlpD